MDIAWLFAGAALFAISIGFVRLFHSLKAGE